MAELDENLKLMIKHKYCIVLTKYLNRKEVLNNSRKFKIVLYELNLALRTELELLHDFKEILEEKLEKVDDDETRDIINNYIRNMERKIELVREELSYIRLEYETCNNEMIETKKEIKTLKEGIDSVDIIFKN